MPAMTTHRPAGPADADTILALTRGFYREMSLPFDESVAPLALAQLLAANDLGRVFIIEEADTAIGYLVMTRSFSLEFGGAFYLLDEFYIEPPFRGHGAGSAALRFAQTWAGTTPIRLEVDAGDQRKKGLYARCGFVLQNRNLMSWRSEA